MIRGPGNPGERIANFRHNRHRRIMVEPPPRRVPWGALAWLLPDIPACQRHEWIMAPSELSYSEASRWADRCGLEVSELIYLVSGEVMMRVRSGLPRGSA